MAQSERSLSDIFVSQQNSTDNKPFNNPIVQEGLKQLLNVPSIEGGLGYLDIDLKESDIKVQYQTQSKTTSGFPEATNIKHRNQIIQSQTPK
jgi:hypothetical protein